MDNQHNNQEQSSIDPFIVRSELFQIQHKQRTEGKRVLTQSRIARELKCTQGAVSQALGGDNKPLLLRIHNLLKRRQLKAARQQEVRTRKVA